MSRRIAVAAGALALMAVGSGTYLLRPPRPVVGPPAADPAPPPPAAAADPRKPALYCEFYVFVESRPFVAFLLEQAPEEPSLYRQVYVAKADGDRTDYNVLAGRRPEWRFEATSEPPRLESRVTVPNASQAGISEEDIAIELGGFDPARPDGGWGEASLKSVYYQNLPGKCRRTAA